MRESEGALTPTDPLTTMHYCGVPMAANDFISKPCSVCKVEKPLTAFYRSKETKAGYASRCKECRKRLEKYNFANLPSEKACTNCRLTKSISEFYVGPVRGPASYCKLCENKLRYQRDKGEVARARANKWAARNREKIRIKSLEQYYKNKERYRHAVLKRIAKKKGAGGTYTIAQIRNLAKLQKHRCVVCTISIAKKYHVDHIYPLSKGGSNDISNIQLLCPSCNMSKHATDPITFMQSRGLLL